MHSIKRIYQEMKLKPKSIRNNIKSIRRINEHLIWHGCYVMERNWSEWKSVYIFSLVFKYLNEFKSKCLVHISASIKRLFLHNILIYYKIKK